MKKFLVIILSIFFSCKNEKKIDISEKKKESKIETIADIGFRRSYASYENLTDKQLNSLYKTNPSLLQFKESDKYGKLFNNLKRLKILEGNCLIEKLFDKGIPKGINYLDEEKSIVFDYSSNFAESNSINLIIKKKKKLIEKRIEFENEHFVGIILEDIDDDKIKEILILDTYYIVNGDNYYLKIMKWVE